MADSKHIVRELSNGLADAVEKGAGFTVLVDGRRGYPASGTFSGPRHVLASSHAVRLDEGIRVMTPSGDSVQAKVAGRDPLHDLALLELEAEAGALPTVASGTRRVGELVLALARPSEDGIQSSLGVVGVSGGTYIGGHGPAVKGMIRSDAAQFPGFSGGPLIDIEGSLIGINIMGRGSLLTVPAETAFGLAKSMEEKGNIKLAYLGVRSQSADLPGGVELGREQSSGLLIVGVEESSPADTSGMITGDIIVAMSNEILESPGDLLDGLAGRTEGDTVELDVVRGGNLMSIQVVLGGREYEHHSGKRRSGKHHGRMRRHGR